MAMKNGAGFVLMFAVDSRDSFNEMKELHQDMVVRRGTDDIPIVVCGNKIDVEDRQVTSEEGREFAESIRAKYFEFSVRNRDNTKEMFNELARTLQEWYRRHPELHKKEELSGEPGRKKKRKGIAKCSVA